MNINLVMFNFIDGIFIDENFEVIEQINENK